MLRSAALAGEFYPENNKELSGIINKLLDRANPPKIKGEIFGLLLPHAGYAYSGQVAAYGFKAIIGKKFDTVIIMGDSHYERFDGVAVWSEEGFWETPLGKVMVDKKLTRTVLDSSRRFFRRDSAHLWEHSIEVQLPFLQRISVKNFKILPIIFGSENKDWQLLARVIFKNIKNRKVLIIASADLSHYLSYKEAKDIDEKTLKNILNLRVSNLNICAIDSVKTLIETTKLLGGKASLLKYANSGDTAGDKPPHQNFGGRGKSKVVGYGAIAFYK
ncbi:MAG: AmmeMemoRadiSam system protein B [Candidatus Nealsonbacteria bacterium]|nr:AmmeMemoRadiSam system protein B [Candidatus Nealsonbacteria bacterium]